MAELCTLAGKLGCGIGVPGSGIKYSIKQGNVNVR